MTYANQPIRIHEIRTPLTETVRPIFENLPHETYPTFDSIHRRMVTILGLVVLVGMVLLSIKPESAVSSAGSITGNIVAGQAESSSMSVEGAGPSAESTKNDLAVGTNISPIFSREVQYWGEKIATWSQQYGLDPNMVAIIMQVESCGDPQAVSVAGASGLFQVMPFHFQASEDRFDPDINAMRGLKYFAERLAQTNGDVGRAFAGYNGGHVAAGGSWDSWANETQRYYVWTTGLYEDVNSGLDSSPTLQRWLAAGGASLCQQAAQRLGI